MRDAGSHDFLVVLPATTHLDLRAVARITGIPGVHLEDPDELARLFPDCEPGAMPPFGRLYGMRTWVDPCLADEEILYFQAGNHSEVVRMRYCDYAVLAAPHFPESCLHRELISVVG